MQRRQCRQRTQRVQVERVTKDDQLKFGEAWKSPDWRNILIPHRDEPQPLKASKRFEAGKARQACSRHERQSAKPRPRPERTKIRHPRNRGDVFKRRAGAQPRPSSRSIAVEFDEIRQPPDRFHAIFRKAVLNREVTKLFESLEQRESIGSARRAMY